MIKGHNFVKNKKTKNSKSHAYLQIMTKHSAKFQVSLIKDVAGFAGTMYESAKAITSSKMAETKIRNHMHIFISMAQRKTRLTLYFSKTGFILNSENLSHPP